MFINDMLIRRDHDQVIRNIHRRGQDDMGGLHGVTGTNNIAGMITDEDENREWNEPILRAKNVNLMRKTCVRTRQSMMLLKTPILGATMRIEPASDSNADIQNALLVEEMLFDSPFFRWDDILRQQLTYLDHGHCVDIETEIFTQSGWKHHDEVAEGDMVWTLNPNTELGEWQSIQKLNKFYGKFRMRRLQTKDHDSLSTKNHRWPTLAYDTKKFVWKTSETLNTNDVLLRAVPAAKLPPEKTYPDAFVELMAWFTTEGQWHKSSAVIWQQIHSQAVERCLTILFGFAVEKLHKARIHKRPAWRKDWTTGGFGSGCFRYMLNNFAAARIRDFCDKKKAVDTKFILKLTRDQLKLFIETVVKADGCDSNGQITFYQKEESRLTAVMLACALLGLVTTRRTAKLKNGGEMIGFTIGKKYVTNRPVAAVRRSPGVDTWIEYSGQVWCPTVENGTWFARRNGTTYFTGNSILEKAYTRLNGKLWLNKIEFRMQDTIFEWDAPEGVLEQVRQSNVFHSSEREPLPMSAESIIHTAYEQEGNNFAGFSALRAAWINWKAKMFLLKGDMVRYERWGIGTPMITSQSGDIPDEAIEAVQKFRSNDEGFLATTTKWALSIFGGGRNSGMDVHTMVLFHDHQIIFNVMANFMAKGEAQIGNFALTKVAADMFFNNVERESNHIENVWNEPSGLMSNIPQIIELNVGEGVPNPKLRIENLQLDDLNGFAERASKYVSSGLLDPTDDIKRHVREIEHLSLTDLDDEQLEDMVNINPTIKRIDSGRPYVLQYRRVNNMLLLQGTAVVESKLEKVVANQLKSISGTLAIKGRNILETADALDQVESMCSAVKIPHNVTLTNSIIVEADIDDKHFDMVKAFVNEFYEAIRETWEAEVVRQFESERTDLGDIAKLVALIPTKAISKKIQGLA